MNFTKMINQAMSCVGLRICRATPFPPPFGENAFHDMSRLVRNEAPVIFDVGANIGQTIDQLQTIMPQSVIHAFEPSAANFQELKKRKGGNSRVVLNNVALGAEVGIKPL